MKTRQDPRHHKRQQLVKALFAWEFHHQRNSHSQASRIAEHLPAIDKKIAHAAPEWPLPQIAKTDLAILRLATFELSVERTEPPKVIIDEAVELAKEFGGEGSPSFVNGVLGTILASSNKESKKEENPASKTN